jgi:hypothetical protein
MFHADQGLQIVGRSYLLCKQGRYFLQVGALVLQSQERNYVNHLFMCTTL